jgi:hypothetical protein
MQKRASLARRGNGALNLAKRASLVLIATGVGSLTGALGLQCSGAAMTTVRTTQERIGQGRTSAENG